MLTLDSLRAWGANVDEGLGRCFGKEDFYLRLVRMCMDDKPFVKLDEAVSSRDVKAAFEVAHGLKGSMGNVALKPIYDPISEITEKTRNQSQWVDISEPCQRARAAFESLKQLDK